MRLLRTENENVRDEGAVEALAAALDWHARAANSAKGGTRAVEVARPARRDSGYMYRSLPAMRQHGRRLLEESRQQIKAEAEKGVNEQEEDEDAEDTELWLEQMAQNYNDGNLDLAELADASSLDTLLRLLRVPDATMAAEVHATLAVAAADGDELPPPRQWSEFLATLLEAVEPAPLAEELCAAAWSGDAGSVGLMLLLPSPRTSPDQRNAVGNTALGQAALAGRASVVKLLLQAKADPELPNSLGARAIHQAAWVDEPTIVDALLRVKAEVDATTAAGDTPLGVAAARNSARVAMVLIDASANIDCTNSAGESPLGAAATRGHVEVARLLLRAGASTYSTIGPSGKNIIDWAHAEMRNTLFLSRQSKLQKNRMLIAEEIIGNFGAHDGRCVATNVVRDLGKSKSCLQMVIVKGQHRQHDSDAPCWALPEPWTKRLQQQRQQRVGAAQAAKQWNEIHDVIVDIYRCHNVDRDANEVMRKWVRKHGLHSEYQQQLQLLQLLLSNIREKYRWDEDMTPQMSSPYLIEWSIDREAVQQSTSRRILKATETNQKSPSGREYVSPIIVDATTPTLEELMRHLEQESSELE